MREEEREIERREFNEKFGSPITYHGSDSFGKITVIQSRLIKDTNQY
jgi:hypothetical protein